MVYTWGCRKPIIHEDSFHGPSLYSWWKLDVLILLIVSGGSDSQSYSEYRTSGYQIPSIPHNKFKRLFNLPGMKTGWYTLSWQSLQKDKIRLVWTKVILICNWFVRKSTIFLSRKTRVIYTFYDWLFPVLS